MEGGPQLSSTSQHGECIWKGSQHLVGTAGKAIGASSQPPCPPPAAVTLLISTLLAVHLQSLHPAEETLACMWYPLMLIGWKRGRRCEQ